MTGVLDLQNYNITAFEFSRKRLTDFGNLLRNPNVENEEGCTGLHIIALSQKDDPELVVDFIRRGGEVDIRNETGKSPLLLAVVHRQKKVIKKLLDLGADVNIKDYSENTALHYMALHVLNDFWEFCASDNNMNYDVNNDEYIPPFSFDSTYSILKLLLDNRADVEARNGNLETPLMWAARGIYLDIIKMLLKYGANVRVQNYDLETSLHWAAGYDTLHNDIELWEKLNCDVVIELVRHKASVNRFDMRNKTALFYIRQSKRLNRERCEKALLKAGSLANWENRIEFYLCQGRIVGRHGEDLSLASYINACYEEINKMKIVQVSSEFNLCQYALEGMPETDPSSDTKIRDKILDILLKNTFPIYQDFIFSGLERSYIREKMSEFGIFTVIEDKKVSLNSEATFKLSAFLENSEIFNVITIFGSLDLEPDTTNMFSVTS